MLKVILNKKEEDNILNGYPWVFNNEVNNFIGNIENGKVCSVYTYDNKFIAYGFLNTNSKIMVRILSLDENEVIDKEFFKKRIQYAIEHRNNLGWNATRLVFSEADFLPGLVVDKYGDYLSVQFMSLGMDMIKNDIVDIENGQKTGYFLDQKLNRDILRLYAKDKNVLDAFSNVGGFTLHACKYGAKSVVACDISQRACDEITNNAILNGYTQLEAKCVDVFDFLHSEEANQAFDVIILVIDSIITNSVYGVYL